MARIAASLVVLLTCSTAAGRDVYGMKIPDTVDSGGVTLRLNGAGVREGPTSGASWQTGVYYVCALYLTAPASNMAAIVGSDAPWVMHAHYAMSFSQKQIMDAFRTSFAQSYPKEKLAVLLPKLDRLAPAIPEVKMGQTLVLAYQPGTGTTVGLDGGAQVTVEGKEFADALLGIWVGPKPGQETLKKKLLGL